MPIRKLWDHVIETKEEFMPRKEKVYPLSREEREEMHEFIEEQLRKSTSDPQSYLKQHLYFLWEKKIVRNIWFRTIDI